MLHASNQFLLLLFSLLLLYWHVSHIATHIANAVTEPVLTADAPLTRELGEGVGAGGGGLLVGGGVGVTPDTATVAVVVPV